MPMQCNSDSGGRLVSRPNVAVCDGAGGVGSIEVLQRRAAAGGFTLGIVPETDGPRYYLLSRWGMSRELPDLGAVALFLRKAGVPA